MKSSFFRPLILLGLTFFLVSVFSYLKIDHNRMRLSPEALVENGGIPPSPVATYVVGNPHSLQPTALAFPTPSPTSTVYVEPLGTATPFGVLPENPENQGLSAFIHAPPGLLPSPYVILNAFGPNAGTAIEIKGHVNLTEFVCTGSPCKVPLTESAIVIFKAYDANGNESNEIQARVRVEKQEGGWLVVIDSMSQITRYSDACANIWGVKDELGQSWSQFPQSPFQLNTDQKLHLLATHLISTGIVDASDCPGGGLTPSKDAPTGCGMARANTKMIEWQNQFDFSIWSASAEIGIPPRILKTLIGYESQFWPSDEQYYVDEIGLGQLNQLGVDLLLRQDPNFFQQICPKILSDCSKPYTSLDEDTQALVRGAVLNSVDAVCVECLYGIDLVKANQSITLIAQTLRANCKIVNSLGLSNEPGITYDDLWKFTMVSYHSGFGCLKDAVDVTIKAGKPVDWTNVSNSLHCRGSDKYVNGFWASLLSFDQYLLNAEALALVETVPTFIPTPTPIPPPTAHPSSAQVEARVYMDENGNGQPDNSEWLDGIVVELALSDHTSLSGITVNGKVIFNLSSYAAGSNVIVRLPGLYREKMFTLPEQGTVRVDFVFTPPNYPNELP